MGGRGIWQETVSKPYLDYNKKEKQIMPKTLTEGIQVLINQNQNQSDKFAFIATWNKSYGIKKITTEDGSILTLPIFECVKKEGNINLPNAKQVNLLLEQKENGESLSLKIYRHPLVKDDNKN